MDISKIEAGKLELETTDINLKELLNNSLWIVGEKAAKHRIQLSLDIEKSLPGLIQADERRF